MKKKIFKGIVFSNQSVEKEYYQHDHYFSNIIHVCSQGCTYKYKLTLIEQMFGPWV